MSRLYTDRQKELQPKRYQYAIDKLIELGFNDFKSDNELTYIKFQFKGHEITLWVYSGWHSGKGIAAGRGIERLLKQLV